MTSESNHQLTNSPTRQFPSVVLFDGVCNLCNGAVAFIIARDRRAQFGFASLQSDAGRRLLREVNGETPLPDTFVLVEEGRAFTQSTAALRIAERLGFPWSLAALFRVLPRPIRDRAYTLVARNRYRWFGKRETCMMPTPDLRRRFLE
jgi:predicted DCC family thiol-disulfide oxidoreductase YuxK